MPASVVKPGSFPQLNTTLQQFPQAYERLKYWQTFISSDPQKQNQIKADEKQWTMYVWAGIPDELRPKVWNQIVSTHKHSPMLPSSTPTPKPRFLQQLDPVVTTYQLFSTPDKHLNPSQSQGVDMAMKYVAHHFDFENYIDGTYDILASASQFIQFTQLYQLLSVLYTILKPVWAGTLLQQRAIQTFAVTFLNTLHRDCLPLLYKLSYMGLDVSDLQLFISTWMLTLGSQHFPFTYTHRIIDILLLDNVGIATLSGVFMGSLLHFHQLSGGHDQWGFPVHPSPPTPAPPSPAPETPTSPHSQQFNTQPVNNAQPGQVLSKPLGFDIQSLHQFPSHPNLNVDAIFFLGFQYFRDRYPTIELAAININWKNLLTQPFHSGFRIFNNPTIASAHKDVPNQFPALDLKSPYGDPQSISAQKSSVSKLTQSANLTITPNDPIVKLLQSVPPEKLKPSPADHQQACRVANPICQRSFFPSIYSNQFGSSLPTIGGYNTLSIRLSDIAKVLHVVNQRFYRKREKVSQRQKKLSPNYVAMMMNIIATTKGNAAAASAAKAANNRPTQTATELNTKTLQELLSDLRHSLLQAHSVTGKLSTDLWTKQMFMDEGQEETEVDLSNHLVILSQLLAHTSRAIETLDKRTVLQLHDIPPTPIHPQEFLQPNTHERLLLQTGPQGGQLTSDQSDVKGMIPSNHLPYYLTRPYVQMEGYLFKALFSTSQGENPILSGSTHPTMLTTNTPTSIPESRSTHPSTQQKTPALLSSTDSSPATGSFRIASVSSRYYILKGSFLMEYESVNSPSPYKQRCIDLRGRTILADKSSSGYYGHGITIYSRGVESGILLQLFTKHQAEFERWLVALSAAIVLPKSSPPTIPSPQAAKNSPPQPPTPVSATSPPSKSPTPPAPFGFGPSGTIRAQPQPQSGHLSHLQKK